MILSELSERAISAKLAHQGLNLQIGPFSVGIKSSIPQVIKGIQVLYSDYPVINDSGFLDFHIRLAKPKNLRRWIHPQVLFHFDDRVPFKPLPLAQAFPFFEWGLNWCIAAHANNYLILHAAVIEKNGRAMIFPGEPGAGKSTLCAALVLRGWRLLSDEMAVIDLASKKLIAIPRPISLKNESIDVIRKFSPEITLGPVAEDTSKGTVTHVKPPQESIINRMDQAIPAWIVRPNYSPNIESKLEVEDGGESFMNLVKNAFNYSVLGGEAFQTLGDVVDNCDCYRYSYSDLEDAICVFDNLAKQNSA